MSSPAYDTPLTLELGASPTLRALLWGLYGLAAGGLLLLTPAWAGVGMTLLVVSAVWEWRRRTAPAVRLCWRADGTWEQPGAEDPGHLLGSTFLSPWLVVLVLDDGRRVRRWAIVRDGVAAIAWRRLRARLRVQGPQVERGA